MDPEEYSTKFFYGGFALRSNSLFYAIFDIKGTPFIYIYLPLKNDIAFTDLLNKNNSL